MDKDYYNKIAVFDKQGAIGRYLKERLIIESNTYVSTFKKVNTFINYKKKNDCLFLLFLIYDEDESLFANYLMLKSFDIPIILCPLNTALFEKFSQIEDVEVMNMAEKRSEYVSKIIKLINIHTA